MKVCILKFGVHFTQGEPFPHVFIPRKLIRNGMMMWTMATYVPHPANTAGKLPYFIVIVPHLRPNDGGGPQAVRKMMQEWPLTRSKPHVVVDSGFGSFGLMQDIIAWGGAATMSLPSNECQQLNTLLSYNLPLDHWRACINAQGIIFSAQKKTVETASGSTAIGLKFVISNAFTADVLPTVNISITAAGEYFLFELTLKLIPTCQDLMKQPSKEW